MSLMSLLSPGVDVALFPEDVTQPVLGGDTDICGHLSYKDPVGWSQ